MNLHRVTGNADWDTVSHQERNSFQRVAVATYGILTVANIVSLIGFGVTLWGILKLYDHAYWYGFGLIAGGRLLDIVDGVIAEQTGTKSRLGEAVDATADKFATGFVLLLLPFSGTIPSLAAIALVVPQVLAMLLSLRAFFSGRALHPSRTGKISMALLWIAILGFIFHQAAYPHLSASILTVCSILSGLCLVTGCSAVQAYIGESLRPPSQPT